MATNERPGYDAPRRTQAEDDLDRWRFAAEVVSLVTSTPTEWSVRVGVFGKWGEGKTSVLHFADQMLKSAGNLVFWFNPWAITDWNELWAEFARKLIAALNEADIDVEGMSKVKRRLFWRWVQQPIEQLSGLNAASKATVTAAISLVGQALQINGPQLKAIREKLGEKRVVVIVDDLDCADPKLVPQLLLALRELFDLPGFAFLLGFDDQMVTDALTSYHPGWTGPRRLDFLEKILDFRLPLPPMTSLQQQRLLKSAVPQFCPFVDVNAFNQVEDLLPTNPRKLKTLVRNLAVLKSEVSRHDSDELNWVDILIAQLIKVESPEFFDRFMAGEILGEQTGIVYQLNQEFRERRFGEDRDADPNAKIKEYLKEWKMNDLEQQDRIVKLIEALRVRGSASFRYQAEFALRPHRITWKEFRNVFANWKAKSHPETLGSWLQQHAASRSATVQDVAFELFDTAAKFRDQQLDRASQSEALDEHEAAMIEAHWALRLIGMLVSGRVSQLGQLLGTPENFEQIFKRSMYWIHFRTNQADAAARQEEKEFLLNFVRASLPRPDTYLNILKPWGWEHEFAPLMPQARELQTQLRDELVDPLARRVTDEVFRLFEMPNGIAQLNEVNRLIPYKYVLFNAKSPLWSDQLLRRTLLVIFERAASDTTIHDNCIDFFDLILRGMRNGLEGSPVEDLRRLPQDQEFVAHLWKGVVARKIQYRMQRHILEGRQNLIDAGTPEGVLTVPEWLADSQPNPRGDR
jgi:hypothetical protein